MVSIIPAPNVSRPPDGHSRRSSPKRPLLSELMPLKKAKSPKIFSGATISYPAYKKAGGKMNGRAIGRLMAQRPNPRIRQMANAISSQLVKPLEGVELEMCAKLLCVMELKGNYSELLQEGPAQKKLLDEIRCLAAASQVR